MSRWYSIVTTASMALGHAMTTLLHAPQHELRIAISSDDPEIWVTNTGPANGVPDSVGSWNHHGNHAREIKEYADAAGVPNVAVYGDPLIYADPSGEFYLDFIYRKLGL